MTSLQDQKSSTIKAVLNVDINLLLDQLSHTLIAVGNWINVFGYVRQPIPPCNSGVQPKPSKSNGRDIPIPSIYVEAVMLIPAGPVRVEEYERALIESREMETRHENISMTKSHRCNFDD